MICKKVVVRKPIFYAGWVVDLTDNRFKYPCQSFWVNEAITYDGTQILVTKWDDYVNPQLEFNFDEAKGQATMDNEYKELLEGIKRGTVSVDDAKKGLDQAMMRFAQSNKEKRICVFCGEADPQTQECPNNAWTKRHSI